MFVGGSDFRIDHCYNADSFRTLAEFPHVDQSSTVWHAETIAGCIVREHARLFGLMSRHPSRTAGELNSRFKVRSATTALPQLKISHHNDNYISAEEMKELRAMFNTLDKDGQGTIGAEELMELMKTIGVSASEEDVYMLLMEVDTDHSGEIEFPEFVRAMTKRIRLPFNVATIKEAFRILAGAGAPPNCIKASQLELVMNRLGALHEVPPGTDRTLWGLAPERKGKGNTSAGRGGMISSSSFSSSSNMPGTRRSSTAGSAPAGMPSLSRFESNSRRGSVSRATDSRASVAAGADAASAPAEREPITEDKLRNLLKSLEPDEEGWINYEAAINNLMNAR